LSYIRHPRSIPSDRKHASRNFWLMISEEGTLRRKRRRKLCSRLFTAAVTLPPEPSRMPSFAARHPYSPLLAQPPPRDKEGQGESTSSPPSSARSSHAQTPAHLCSVQVAPSRLAPALFATLPLTPSLSSLSLPLPRGSRQGPAAMRRPDSGTKPPAVVATLGHDVAAAVGD
jgi:hypothetical protein